MSQSNYGESFSSNHERFFTLEDENSSSITNTELGDEAPDVDKLNLAPQDILRIEQRTIGTFSGVRSCSKAETHRANANMALERWARHKMHQYRDLMYLRYGWTDGQAYWTNRTRWGKRSCSGRVDILCFIEFRKADPTES